jgi:ribosome-binding protein aMBF1 (putative translation factor)
MYKPVSHDKFLEECRKDPEFVKEYERQAPERELLHEMLKARKKANLSQTEVAGRMGTKASAVSRLESLNDRRSPSLNTLRNYAEALGFRLKIKFVPT